MADLPEKISVGISLTDALTSKGEPFTFSPSDLDRKDLSLFMSGARIVEYGEKAYELTEDRAHFHQGCPVRTLTYYPCKPVRECW